MPIAIDMDLDALLGVLALLIALGLGAFRAPLAAHLREGDEHWRERHPWTAAYEPQGGRIATDEGRLTTFRVGLTLAALAFAAVGAGLLARGLGA